MSSNPASPFISLNVLQIKAASSPVKASPDSLLFIPLGSAHLSTAIYRLRRVIAGSEAAGCLPALQLPPAHGCAGLGARVCTGKRRGTGDAGGGGGRWGMGRGGFRANSANQKQNQTPLTKPSKWKAAKRLASTNV